MAKNRFRKNKQLVPALIGAAIVFIPFAGIGGYYVYNLNEKHAVEIAQYENQISQLSASQALVYGLTSDIQAGTRIRAEDLQNVTVDATRVPADAIIDDSAIGKFTKIALTAGTPLTQEMLYENGITPQDLRNQEFRMIELPTKLEKNDYVDVRVKFPSGEDFIVLAKKQVEDLNNGTVWHTMNEQEILKMSSAIVDAYLNDASIYSISYVEPGIQEAAKVTYPANQAVLDLIESDPNIVQKATTALERKLRQKLENNLNELTPEQIQKYLNNKQNASKINPDTQTNPLTEDPPIVDDGSTTNQ
ncbi:MULTISPECIES: SAF domain-containing protein [Paenibacillus]|uniref:SAF domain-containing protein n=1 Tax=Paenibacillus TaxID=44249 RepID=UPI00201E00F6|nr:SAF domain-containing protein [Paenibacillus amylolyticus]MCL6663456.1 SAF domain-containing protein [Paenibacillus amylolyticus]